MADKGLFKLIFKAIFDDPKYQALEPNSKLVLLTLICSRLNNTAGIFFFRAGENVTLQEMTGLSKNRTEAALRELVDTHWIAIQYPILWVCEALDNDPAINLNNPKHKTGVQNIAKSLPNCEILLKFCERYDLPYPFDSPSIAYRYPFDTNNNININNNIKIKSKSNNKRRDKSRDCIPYEKIIKSLNQRIGKKPDRGFQSDSSNTKGLIKARWNEGFRLTDFFKVHKVKAAEWIGTDMEKHLNPSTLYRPANFEKYLQQWKPQAERRTLADEFANRP